MKNAQKFGMSLSIISFAFFAIEPAFAATVQPRRISKDKSIATVTLTNGEKIYFPVKDGTPVLVECKGAGSCEVKIADFTV